MARWVHSEQAEVATVSAKLNIDASSEARGLLRQQEFPFLHVGTDAVGIGAITIDEGLLDAERRVDQTSERINVALDSGSDAGSCRAACGIHDVCHGTVYTTVLQGFDSDF